MTLSATACAILRACSETMAQGTEMEIDLYDFRRDFGTAEDEILAELARGVEEASGNQRTVRSGDSALFEHHVMGPGLYLAVCNMSTSSGVVTELSDDMVLYIVGPYSGGLSLNGRASQEAVEHYRASVAEGNRHREQSLRGKQEIEDLFAKLRERLETRIAACADDEQRSDAEYAFRNADLSCSLEDIAEACAALDVPLKELLAEVD